MTGGPSRQPKILNVWEVDRETEVIKAECRLLSDTQVLKTSPPAPLKGCCIIQGERFSENQILENRRLLWHGTNIAVVAAILKSGLRIMPHSGGRVGRGIYFASENCKSAGYGESVWEKHKTCANVWRQMVSWNSRSSSCFVWHASEYFQKHWRDVPV